MMDTINLPRVLIIDDNKAIHEDFEKILYQGPSSAVEELGDLESRLFDDRESDMVLETFDLHHAYQGGTGFEMVCRARETGKPFALAFVDVRMPPGWDGVETVKKIFREDDEIQIVLCTAFSDYSWKGIISQVGESDRLLILKKPFDPIEVAQLAHALTRKWSTHRHTSQLLSDLECLVAERSAQLEREVEIRKRVESEQESSHHLERIGRLAAGIAAEIDSPIQSLGDSASYLREMFARILRLVAHYRQVCHIVEHENDSLVKAVKELEDEVNLAFIEKEIPHSLDSSIDGIHRVAAIVRALREYVTGARGQVEPMDINRAIENIVTMTRNEYRRVADVELELAELPPVVCNSCDVNRTILNLLVNAIHAIEDLVSGTEDLGRITIKTGVRGERVEILISDTGVGIPPGIRDRVFESFFTTKEIGRGTGQGLAFARAAIVERHGGEVDFESREGIGTTFRVSIPIAACAGAAPGPGA